MADIIEKVRIKLQKKIRDEGKIIGDEFLKVDSFLNHQVNTELVELLGRAIAQHFLSYPIDKVVTVEAGGNMLAYETAKSLDYIDAIYAKKGKPCTMTEEEAVSTKIKSPTKGGEAKIFLSKEYVKPEDRVLVVDDFLFTGTTSKALISLLEKEIGAEIVGCGYVIRKGDKGLKKVKKTGLPIFSLVYIPKLGKNTKELEFENPTIITS